MRSVLFFFVFYFFILNSISADIIYQKQDSLLYNKYIDSFEKKTDLPLNELLVETALYFRGSPYVASTLDENDKEQLVINLREFDCTTFVETCIALSRTVKTGETSFLNFCEQLETIRYRGGSLSDYASRLHYMTDWIYDNQQKGIISNITSITGGINDNKRINFMSAHVSSYPTLQRDSKQRIKIEEIEKKLNTRKDYSYIKKDDISKVEHLIENGDIIIFATSIDGLDYSHIGIAYHNKGKLTFIHASSKAMKVIVEPLSLLEYCSKSRRCVGISVLRLRLNNIEKK